MSAIQIIVAADEPALFFSSVAAAEGYIEAGDVDTCTAIYGSKGEVYSIRAFNSRTIIEFNESESAKPNELVDLLLNFLSSINVTPKSNNSVSVLLEQCETHLTA